jgi:hypothetical protein
MSEIVTLIAREKALQSIICFIFRDDSIHPNLRTLEAARAREALPKLKAMWNP